MSGEGDLPCSWGPLFLASYLKSLASAEVSKLCHCPWGSKAPRLPKKPFGVCSGNRETCCRVPGRRQPSAPGGFSGWSVVPGADLLWTFSDFFLADKVKMITFIYYFKMLFNLSQSERRFKAGFLSVPLSCSCSQAHTRGQPSPLQGAALFSWADTSCCSAVWIL